jgi:DNA-directed RNA polymerase beta' subunit
MPKLIDYPRASFPRVLEMAEAIDYLGGSCTVETCAEKMGVKVTGAFTALIGAAKKHGLIASEKNSLKTTPLFRNIKLAYDDHEKRQNLRIAFLTPPLYKKLYERFIGKELPIKMLDKLMIREFGVEEDFAQRVMNYFLEGTKTYEILVDNKIADIDIKTESLANNNQNKVDDEEMEIAENTGTEVKVRDNFGFDVYSAPSQVSSTTTSSDNYTIHIYGPGINSKLSISEEDDFLILDAMIFKLKKKFKN